MRLLEAQTDTANFIYPIRIPVSVRAFLFRITGTADVTGVKIEDFGRIVIRNRGNTVVDIDLAVLLALNNVGGGVAEATGLGAAGAYAVTVAIPRNYFDDNVDLINPTDNAEFTIQFGPNIAAHTASGFVAELYAIESFGVQTYQLTIKQNEENIAGAGSIPATVNQSENICGIYYTDIPGGGTVRTLVASTISRVRYNVGNAFTGEFSNAAGLARTNIDNRVETAQSLLCEVYAAKNGDITSRLEDQAQLTFTTTGVARPQIVVLGCMFNPNKLQETANAANSRLTEKINAKDATGKKRTSATVRAIVSASQ